MTDLPDLADRHDLPMSSEAAAWVREHVWTRPMRQSYADVPGYWQRCACQGGPCGHCSAGRHDQCHGQLIPRPETYVDARDGGALVAVWLAERVCRWVCPCATAGHGQPAEQTAEDDDLGGQLSLFG